MFNTIYYPSEDLAPFVEFYQIWRTDTSMQEQMAIRDYPRTAMDMVFCFEGSLQINIDQQQSFDVMKAAFISHFDQPYNILLKEQLSLLHIRFKPNGIYPLTKIPLHSLVNGQLALNDFTENFSPEFYEQLAEHEDDQTRIQLFEENLLAIYRSNDRHHRLDYGLEIIKQHKGVLTVKALSEKLNTNYKSLDRWFQNKVGLPPKRFMQITRFKHILDDLSKPSPPDWMQLVNDYGFHDQAHLIKDFQQFARVSPGNFAHRSG